MDFNFRQIQTYTSIFNRAEDLSPLSNTLLNLTDDAVFKRFCTVNIGGDDIEIPVFVKFAVEKIINYNLKFGYKYTKVVVPMYVNTNSQVRRTFDSIIKQLFMRVNFNDRLQKIVTSKGEVYFGTRGLILDKDFSPLLMCTVNCEKAGNDMMRYTKVTIYVHPKVFLEPNGLMQKAINKNIVPFYLTNNVSLTPQFDSFMFSSDITPQVIIADMTKKFIETPSKPTPKNCSNEMINKMLNDNIEDVLDIIRI